MILLALALLGLSGCASPPPERAPAGPSILPPVLAVPDTPGAFAALATWQEARLANGVEAFKRSCAQMGARNPADILSPKAPWAGRIDDWTGLCEALKLVEDETGARRIIEALTLPVEIVSRDGKTRFTGYFEPMIEARRAPDGTYSAPIPGPPGDLEQTSSGPVQRLPGGRTRAYPARADITPNPATILGYARPGDIFFLQIQGSGRLLFPDGTTRRAAYFAHNGRPFRSTADWLLERGEIRRAEASMQGIEAWMEGASPDRVREAMNANPRYVFFRELPEGDPSLGPVGAAAIPLTSLGSMAVDTDLHALGVPFLVQTKAPGLGGDWSGLLVSQDTGGAIIGAVRGDIYFGTGDEAGERAGTMNAPGRMWALLPRATALRLQTERVADHAFATRVYAP